MPIFQANYQAEKFAQKLPVFIIFREYDWI